MNDTYGEFVHAYDTVTGESHYFWAFVGGAYKEWEEWLDYIGALMESHGMALG